MHSISNRCKGGIEVRMGHAAAFARAAIVTGTAAILRLGEVGRTREGDRAAKLLLYAIPEDRFLAGEWHRRLKLTVRKPFQTFGHAGDADVPLHQVVVGYEILIAQRPIFTLPIARRGFEIPVTIAQAYAAPNVCAPPHHARSAEPVVGFVCRRGVG